MNNKKTNLNNKIVDGWSNLLSSLNVSGKSLDPATNFSLDGRLSAELLTSLFIEDGYAKKIINKFATDMTRQWISINGDPDNIILNKLKNIKAKKSFTSLIKWARLYGGAIIIMGINDGRDLSEPVNENAIKSIDFLHVIDNQFVTIDFTNYYTDPSEPKFGTPQIYRVSGNYVPLSTQTKNSRKKTKVIYDVHETRILRLDGDELPISRQNLNDGWGTSILQHSYTQLKHLNAVFGYLAEAVHKYSTSIYQIENLSQLISAGNEELVKNRLQIINTCKSFLNAIVLDKGEEYTDSTLQLSGLTDVLDKFILALSAVTGIPKVILMGDSPSGLNATGDSDISNWYDEIKGEQEESLEPLLTKLVYFIIKSREMPINIRKLDKSEWNIKFNPLTLPDEKKQADTRFVIAQTDSLYMDHDVLDSEEVKQSRFGGGDYSIETKLIETPELTTIPIEPDKDNSE